MSSKAQLKEVILLGSGTSTGVPMLGCRCDVCLSKDPKHHRTRASVLLVTNQNRHILIDTSPEMRLQLLREGVGSIHAVLYTHTHSDHCHGFDDLRALSFEKKQKIPCYLAPDHEREFRERFSYVFKDTGYTGFKPLVEIRSYDQGTYEIEGLEIEVVRLAHGSTKTCGYRLGNFAYLTDFKSLPPEIVERWRNKIEYMIASGVHFKTHSTHSVIPETVKLFQELGVKQAYIGHLSHEVDYIKHQSLLPPGIEFGFDGLRISF